MDRLIVRIKEFRDYVGKYEGQEIRGSRAEDRFRQDLYFMTRWGLQHIDNAKLNDNFDLNNLADALKD